MIEKKLNKAPYIHENCKILNSQLGQFTEVGMYNYFENVKFGDYSYAGEFCFFQNVEIGKFSNIAAMVRIGPTDHPMERPSLHHFTYRRKMYGFDVEDDEAFFQWRKKQKSDIGNDTWIGHGAIIMPGVKIGNGAVVGSGAVVTKNVDPYTIVVGVPAKPVRKRFDDEIIKKLEEIRWWDWSHETIKERFHDFLLDINRFVDKYYRK
ncbi:DapH/DapD/GlmU-related protein [Clostridiaceae bacterium 35-E11]